MSLRHRPCKIQAAHLHLQVAGLPAALPARAAAERPASRVLLQGQVQSPAKQAAASTTAAANFADAR